MKRFLILSMATLMYGQAMAQTLTGTGAKAESGRGDALSGVLRGGEGQQGTGAQSPLPTPSAFPGCPFTLDIEELVPPGVQTEFLNLHARLSAPESPPECRQQGETIGNLLTLMGLRPSGQRQPTTPTTPTTPTNPGKAGTDDALGGIDLGPSPTQQPPAPSTGSCSSNPARCEQLITQLLEAARSGSSASCYTSGNAIDTLIGMAFQINIPVVGQVALGASVIRGIIGLFRGRRTDAQADMNKFFTQEVPKRQMETLQACYGNKLYQDVNCRQPYLDCLTGHGDRINQSAFCAWGTNLGLSQSGGSEATRGSACAEYTRVRNSTSARIEFQGQQVSKKELLVLCMKDSDETANLNGDDFLVEPSDMADMYACLSYWTNVQRSKGVVISEVTMRPLRDGCLASKRTKGGGPINQYVFEYNRLRTLEDAENLNFVRRELLPDVLGIAQRFHRDQIQRATYQDEPGIQGAVNTCYYGYGVDLATGGQRDGSYRQGRGSLPDRCQNLNNCAERAISGLRSQVQTPSDPRRFYSEIIPVQNLNQMFLNEPASNPGRDRYASDQARICYGMAMNQVTDHSAITMRLRDYNFNGETCTGSGPAPSLLGSDGPGSPSSRQ